MRTTRRLATFAPLAPLALAMVGTARDVVRVVRDGWAGFATLFRAPIEPAPPEPTRLGTSRMNLVTAKAFVLRLGRRDRPLVTPTWRMCPGA